MFVFQLILVFLLITLMTFVIQFRFKRRRMYELAARLPGTDKLPLIGVIHHFAWIPIKDYLSTAIKFIQDNAPFTKIWLGPKLVILTKSPEVINTVFNSPQCSNKPDLFYGSLIFTQGLPALNGNAHKRHRKIFNKAFTSKKLEELYDVVLKRAHILVTKLEKKVDSEEFNVYSFITAFALEVFAESNFNHSQDFYDHELLNFADE